MDCERRGRGREEVNSKHLSPARTAEPEPGGLSSWMNNQRAIRPPFTEYCEKISKLLVVRFNRSEWHFQIQTSSPTRYYYSYERFSWFCINTYNFNNNTYLINVTCCYWSCSTNAKPLTYLVRRKVSNNNNLPISRWRPIISERHLQWFTLFKEDG